MQKPLAWLISTLRSGKTLKYYALIGGASPILDITEAQAKALGEALRPEGDFEIYISMRYWHPYTEEALAEGRTGRCEETYIPDTLPPIFNCYYRFFGERTLQDHR